MHSIRRILAVASGSVSSSAGCYYTSIYDTTC